MAQNASRSSEEAARRSAEAKMSRVNSDDRCVPARRSSLVPQYLPLTPGELTDGERSLNLEYSCFRIVDHRRNSPYFRPSCTRGERKR